MKNANPYTLMGEDPDGEVAENVDADDVLDPHEADIHHTKLSNGVTAAIIVACIAIVAAVVATVAVVMVDTPAPSSKSTGVGKFWQITDIHLDQQYESHKDPSQMCEVGTGDSNLLGNYLCDSPNALLRSAVKFISSHGDPDFVLWTGDDSPHVPSVNLTYSRIMNDIENITKTFQIYFNKSNIPIIPALGNHDTWPKSQIAPNPFYQHLLGNISSMWAQWLSPTNQATFAAGGFFTTAVNNNIRVVSLNTVYYYRANKLTTLETDPAGQFEFLENELKNAETDGVKLYLIGHVPPGQFERCFVGDKPWFYPDFNQRYEELVLQYAHVIAGQFFAHEHSDAFRLFYDPVTNESTSVMWLAPSVTPWKSSFANITPHNPSVRLFKYDRATGEVLDYIQYYTDLNQNIVEGTYDWKQLYSAKAAYGMKDLSAKSWSQLYEQLNTNDTLFDEYTVRNSVDFPVPKCVDRCRDVQLCAIRYVNYDQFQMCVPL
eukprot:m.137514 g.137514  ORF g.137514 m.137514 type:complete len:489 (-) comp29924_c0_seq2:67-1533(-)